MLSSFFFFNDTATTEIYTLSLHDALPISAGAGHSARPRARAVRALPCGRRRLERQRAQGVSRSEEHTSELQSRLHLVCRLLLEKKKKMKVKVCNKTTDRNVHKQQARATSD